MQWLFRGNLFDIIFFSYIRLCRNDKKYIYQFFPLSRFDFDSERISTSALLFSFLPIGSGLVLGLKLLYEVTTGEFYLLYLIVGSCFLEPLESFLGGLFPFVLLVSLAVKKDSSYVNLESFIFLLTHSKSSL